jgi:hypothetical protein
MNVFAEPNRIKTVPAQKSWNLFSFIRSSIDVLIIALAFQCSYFINYRWLGGFFFSEKSIFGLFLGILPFWLLMIHLIKISEIPTKRYKVLFFLYLHSSVAILVLIILFYFVFNLHLLSRLFLIELSFFGFLFLFLVRILEFKLFKNHLIKRHIHTNIVVIADDTSLPFIENLLAKKEMGYKVVVIFTESDLIKEKYENMVIILPEKYLGILKDLIEVDMIDDVFYLKKKFNPEEVRGTVRTCEELGVTFRLRSSDPKISLSSGIRTDIANGKFLSFINLPHSSYALAVKNIMDVNMSLLMLSALFPVFMIIAILIKVTSKGPVIIKQPGVGLRGRRFTLYKFRTKRVTSDKETSDAETMSENGNTFIKPDDISECTFIGKFLIRSGLDELPSLFNVLRGEISMLGPHNTLEIFPSK